MLSLEVVDRDAEAVEEGDGLTIQVALGEGGAADDVEGQVGGGELQLAASEKNLRLVRELACVVTNSEHTFCPTKPDLYSTNT